MCEALCSISRSTTEGREARGAGKKEGGREVVMGEGMSKEEMEGGKTRGYVMLRALSHRRVIAALFCLHEAHGVNLFMERENTTEGLETWFSD